jgi:hypothetical protein
MREFVFIEFAFILTEKREYEKRDGEQERCRKRSRA